MTSTKAFSVLLLMLAACVAGATDMPAKDEIAGVKDHPLLSRYAGSVMVAYLTKAYDETDLVAGKYKQTSDNTPSFEKLIHVEGKITRVAYVYPADRSGLEVMRNYQAAIHAAGMSVVFSCDKAACGTDGSGSDFGGAMEPLKIDTSLENWPSFNESAPFNDGRVEPRYELASLTATGGRVTYAAVYVVPPRDGELGGVLIEIVEPVAMETNKVSVNLTAADMSKAIAAEGKVALYGLYFDSDKAELRSDSKPSLDEIAKLLRQDAGLKVYVVGHTDNQGAYPHNLDLSQRRSDSIVHALTADYKIDAARLSAKGVASVAPVASNDAEAGRAKNRRVELVKQ